MRPSTEELKYFIAAAQTLNFSQAAKKLGISQPSLSLAIQRMENYLDINLFIRDKKGVVLTPAGDALLAHARKLLNQWDEIRTVVRGTMTEVQGCFKIGCHPSVALYSLPTFMPQLLGKYPRLEIQLVHNLSRVIVEQVLAFHIDLGIVINPNPYPNLLMVSLGVDTVSMWSSEKGLNLEKLSGDYTLICDSELLQTQEILKSFNNSKITPKRIIETKSLEVIAELTAAGCGIGILPFRVAQRASKKVFTLEKGPQHQDQIYLITRSENKKVAAICALMSEVKAGFRTLSLPVGASRDP